MFLCPDKFRGPYLSIKWKKYIFSANSSLATDIFLTNRAYLSHCYMNEGCHKYYLLWSMENWKKCYRYSLK